MEKKLKKNDNENDYKHIILQIGRKYTYVGFSGLHKPLSVINTPDIFVYNEKFHNSNEDNEIYEIIEVFSKTKKKENDKNNDEKLLQLNDKKEKEKSKKKNEINDDDRDEEKKIKKETKKKEKNLIYHYEYKYSQDLNLWNIFFEEYLFKIFHNLIKTNIKTKKVIVVLNMFIPTIIKYALCKSLIVNSENSSISYINDLISPLYLCNCNTCLVVDLGYLNCRLLPVMNGLPLYHYCTYINNGGFYINKEIKRLLKEQYIKRDTFKNENLHKKIDNIINDECNSNKDVFNNNDLKNDSKYIKEEMKDESDDFLNYYWNLYTQEEIINVIDSLSDNDIENIKIKYFYLKNDKNNFFSNKYILFQYKKYEIIIEPETRWKACEILFHKNYDQNLYSLFSNILEKLNIMETSVFHNILLVGGCSNIKGIISKIAEVVFQVLKEKNKLAGNFENKVNFLFPKISPNLRQFIGASIYSNLENLPEYTEEHINNNVLYDHLNEDVYMTFKQ
ncbi:actin-like protein, putative [Plasmodium gallinaceum]|uniref:Actin-like protein, putative n=1 Tax=Plasmodium gallinaceum TaxID=5849 RepID=A0A1J1GM02_PLAGA|nr:actin-like protein, putative [Plasmodium gallinaceum]CRG93261.1 actin-like protein, putative [Plasmodium gallinaceum]